MFIRTLALAATATALIAPQAFAQAPAASAPALTIPQQAAVAGVCVFSQEGAIRTSVVGKYVSQRLTQLTAQSNAELTQQQTALQNEARTLQGQQQTMTEGVFNAQVALLNEKGNTFQTLANTRQREFELTENKALQRIFTEINPLMVEVIVARKCSIVIDANSAFYATPLIDITADVVAKLDAKLQQFPFERERLDQQAAAAPAAAPASAPAAAAPARPAAGPARPATTTPPRTTR